MGRATQSTTGSLPLECPRGTVITHRDHGLLMEIPAAGLWEGGSWLLGALGLLGTVALLCAMLILHRKTFEVNHLPFLIIWSMIIGGGGVWCLRNALLLGAQRVTVIAEPGRLRIVRHLLSSAREFVWRQEELREVRLGSTSFDEQRRAQLEIVATTGKTVAILHGRSVEEILFVVESIRGVMRNVKSKGDQL